MSLASNSKSSQLPRYGMTRAANRIFARRMGLAAVMVEQHARRAVHLPDDHALGAVDDEGAVHRHERHVAHVDVLLLDIDDRLGFGVGVDLEAGQAQRDAHRRGIGQPALAALVGVVFGVLELIAVEVEMRGAGEILDREHRAQRLFEAGDIAGRGIGAEELLVAFALNLDEVRHFGDFVDVAEDLADAPRSGGPAAGRARRSLWSPWYSLRCSVVPARAGIQMDSGSRRRKRRSAGPVRPSQCVRPVREFRPCPGKGRKSPGRTSPCGGAVMFWMEPI